MAVATLKVDKLVSIGYGKGRGYVTVLREHYLRDDIKCSHPGCPVCNTASPSDGVIANSHYIIPSGDVLCQYQEVFEHPSLDGLIVTQTAANMVCDEVGHRSYQSLVKVLSSSSKNNVLFDNEHQLECFSLRASNETLNDWRTRLHISAIMWYSSHIVISGVGHDIPIIVLVDTNDEQDYEASLRGCDANITVMPLEHYISSHWCSHGLQALFESLVEVNKTKKHSEQDTHQGFIEYISLDEAENGLLEGRYVAGSLRVSRFHPREEAYVTAHSVINSSYLDLGEVSGSDILIPGISMRNRAIQGDSVVIELLPRTQWKGRSKALPVASGGSHDQSCDSSTPSGRVVAILDRRIADIVATFPEDGGSAGRKERVLVIPYDKTLPKIRISTSLVNELRNHRIVVRIDKWDINSQYPDGHFVRSIGPIGDLETETQSILINHQLSCGSFGSLVHGELPDGVNWSIDPEEVSRRSDLRDTHLVFSIDPRGCEDVDDTLSIRTLKNGDIELGVHIADVSYFVKSGSHTDKEARERSTTIYLADRRYDMLPSVLSANLCSLHSNVDRYAVSVIWRLSSSCEVLKVWHGRTIIRSSYELSYEVAQDIFNGISSFEVIPNIKELRDSTLSKEEIHQRYSELSDAINQLVHVARVLREKRDKKGALELEGVEIKVQLGEEKSVEDLLPKQPLEMHETVAEFMIYANYWLAKKLVKSFPSRALLRHHPEPSDYQFQTLKEAASSKGFTIDSTSNTTLAESLNKAIDPRDPQCNKVLRMMTTHAMPQANYFSTGSMNKEDYYHYGLALDLYTHFTSPIRRYADLIVHRQLLEAIDNDSKTKPTIGDQELSELCTHMNEKKRNAQLAQIASTGLFQALYFLKEQDTRGVAEGVVYSIRSNGVIVYLPRYGIQGAVYLKDKNGLVYCPNHEKETEEPLMLTEGSITFNNHCITVTYPSGQYSFRLFDHISVRIKVDHGRAHPYSFSFQLLKCTPLNDNDSDLASLTQNNSDLIKLVRSEAPRDNIDFNHNAEYSTTTDSLYKLIEQMKTLGLKG